jgi:hypothetical protein
MVLNMPMCIFYIILALPLNFIPTIKFFFALSIVSLLFHFSYATAFFLYILIARVYREELIRLVFKIFPWRRGIQVQPISMTHRPDTTRHHK